MYFHTNNVRTVNFVERVARLAVDNGQSLRIDVDAAGNLRIKRGEGMWSPPIASDPDAYRDGANR